MDATPMKDCTRQSDHRFTPDARGLDRCAFCGRTWAETVRGFGLSGDLPGQNAGRSARFRRMSDEMNHEAGLV